ncbi:hypothetical protein DOTSEDRAFT_75906 [Dothistroma septosporum NZE10]|uniref:Uncharacterized protein n=1 Tax=Dothistroma septosporum (strain NZE10 / CBS 128990) TaxID=675120 RepID=N1PC10_DOTSN|nr:hypothetical protein DOTSEDRAFT_75906 [Dothistroma septosporum NZE10]
MRLLQQRLSQPSQIEQDFAMVLQFVWEQFTRQAQPSEAVWRLMQRDAPGILQTSTNTNSDHTRYGSAQDAPCPPPVVPSFTAADLGSLLPENSLVHGQAYTDSGHHSTKEKDWS